MDRRQFLESLAAMSLGSFVPPVSAQLPVMPKVIRKHLAPNAHEIIFVGAELKHGVGHYQLLSKGNALWIHDVTWKDENGTAYFQTIRRNLPPEKAMTLPPMIRPQKLMISVTCLPLANAMTVVELMTGSPFLTPKAKV